jgi:transposase InsO family protein
MPLPLPTLYPLQSSAGNHSTKQSNDELTFDPVPQQLPYLLAMDTLSVATLRALGAAADLPPHVSSKRDLTAALKAHLNDTGLTLADLLKTAYADEGPAPVQHAPPPEQRYSGLGNIQLPPPGHFNTEGTARRTRWPDYINEFNLFLAASGASPAPAQKAALLLHCGGPPLRTLVASLNRKALSGESEYDAIVRAVSLRFAPTDTALFDRHVLASSIQRSGESTDDFAARLRRQADLCQLECPHCKSNLADERVLDVLLAQTRLPGLRQRAFEKGLRSLDQVLAAARAMETARAHAAAMEVATGSREQGEALALASGGQPHGAGPAPHPHAAAACPNCGASHMLPRETHCPAYGKACLKCKKSNHFGSVCRSKGPQQRARTAPNAHFVADEGEVTASTSADSFETVFSMGERFRAHVAVEIEGTQRRLLIDSGASVNVVPASFLSGKYEMNKAGPLKVFGRDQSVQPLGSTLLRVGRPGAPHLLRQFLVVPEGEGPALLGLELSLELGVITLSPRAEVSSRSPAVDMLTTSPRPPCENAELRATIAEFAHVFGLDNPGISGVSAHIDVHAGTRAAKLRARYVPLALQDAVDKELGAMIARGSYTPVRTSQFASPVVIVGKPGGAVRICADYSATVAKAINTESYPLPRPADMFAKLADARVFSTLDLRGAFEQIQLDDDSKDLLTIATSRGLLRPNRLPYGVSSASAILQRTMDDILSGIPEASAYCDDAIIATPDYETHARVLKSVLQRFSDHNVRLRAEKCKIGFTELHFLGFVVSEHGRKVDPARIAPITDMHPPKDIPQLRAFLGCCRFYDTFVDGLATLAAPLHALLKKDAPWSWGAGQAKAFADIKSALTSAPTLAHYDPKLPVVVSADASAYGIGAVLAHRFPDGSERPVAFASRTLSSAERGYSQLDKEGLAIVYAVRKFTAYLWATPFTLLTDAKPLMAILAPKRGLPEFTTARLHRFALTLAAFRFTVQHRPGSQNGGPDALSRLPLPLAEADAGDAFAVDTPEELGPISWAELKSATDADPALSRWCKLLPTGIPKKCPEDVLLPLWRHSNALGVHNGALLFGDRVVLPSALRPRYLKELHATHQGATRMRALASAHVFWPGLGGQITALVAECDTCQRHVAAPAMVEGDWPTPTAPWTRVHVDFFAFGGREYLVLVDATSKWLEAACVSSTSASVTIGKLKAWFARFGWPQELHSDGGPPFRSQEFTSTLARWGIRLTLSPPHHPQSNGAAERAVRTLKEGLAKLGAGRLEDLLFRQRATPGAGGVSPHEAMMGRPMRTALEIRAKAEQPEATAPPGFPAGTHVWTRPPGVIRRGGPRWASATVVATPSRVVREVSLADGRRATRHLNQLRRRV